MTGPHAIAQDASHACIADTSGPERRRGAADDRVVGNEHVEYLGNPVKTAVGICTVDRDAVVHLGPRFFDPAAFRAVRFDRRGCGRRPPEDAPGADLSVSTTAHPAADIGRLPEHLGIEWSVR